VASPSSLTRKRVAPVLSIAHSQNVNVAAHVRRCSRNPATLHKKTTVHLLACSYPIQAVFRWPPSASKTQWSRQTLHITRKRYRVSPVTEHLGSNRLPVFLRSSNTTHNQGKFQLCPSLAGRVLAHNLLQPLVCANKSPLPVGRPAAALGFEPMPPTSRCPSNLKLNSGKSRMLMFCGAALSPRGHTHEVCADTLFRHVMTLANSCFKSSAGEKAFWKT